MTLKEIVRDWGSLAGFVMALIGVPLLTALAVAKSYDVTPEQTYWYFILFYSACFLVVGTTHWIKYLARQEVEKALNERKRKK